MTPEALKQWLNDHTDQSEKAEKLLQHYEDILASPEYLISKSELLRQYAERYGIPIVEMPLSLADSADFIIKRIKDE